VVERQTEHLTRLVDDLLDVTRIARGKIELRRSPVDLRAVVLRAVEDFRPMIEERGVALRKIVPDDEVWVNADATRITQVVGNLLHNAAKFTRSGDEVTLSLQVARGESEIRVRDTGAGIDPALLPHVFDAFVQGERTLARTEGGLGLGLALVRGIAELHGGTVVAESPGEGKGTEFVVRLPVLGAAAVEDAPRARLRRAKRRRRVLVVDDNPDAARSLAEVVEMLGHAAVVAYDGASALAKALADPPDTVLCDIGLPGMSGYEVAQALRENREGIQLFAVSGYAQPDDVKKAIAAGFDGHIAKPVDVADLERLLG
jgi:CheY-like chemotaxis protein